MFENFIIPTRGYLLPKWERNYEYRTTAVAYLKRESLYTVEHSNGRWYTLKELQDAIIK